MNQSTDSQSTISDTEEVNPLRLYNTKQRDKEIFEPLDESGHVQMYNCGPTVYDYQHIGNLRAYVFVDVLRRALEANGYEVTQIMNITDVGHLVSDGDTGEDKMSKGLEKEGLPVSLDNMKKLGEKYAKIFKSDLAALNIKKPDKFPKASEHIEEDIAFVQLLESNGYTYEISDGLYFDTSKLDNYGKLAGGIAPDEDTESRVTNEEKRNPRDFAVWKFDNQLGWQSPWGQGFPGWHIECSVMAREYLGDYFDIHTGGIDHIPVHHTNEMAQTQGACGTEMAEFWLHNDFMTIDEEKISKSIGNTLYLKDIEDKGFSPLAYRYLLLGAHYRSEVNFSWESLESAQNSLDRLYRVVRDANLSDGSVEDSYVQGFLNAVNDDLNTPQALAVMWEMVRDDNLHKDDKAGTLIVMDKILGLDLASPPTYEIPDEIKELAKKRRLAREEDNFEKADKLREQINNKGYTVEDTEAGQRILPDDAE
jgi:cysteinyl-tRNA synthetase